MLLVCIVMLSININIVVFVEMNEEYYSVVHSIIIMLFCCTQYNNNAVVHSIIIMLFCCTQYNNNAILLYTV